MPTMTESAPKVLWEAIDTVLVDMDGTLLDLHFDNWFWQDHVPSAWAEARGVTVEEALAHLRPRFESVRGRLEWYCIDHWSRELELDISVMKRAAGGRIGWLPGAQQFLERLSVSGKKRWLLTNAHPETFAIKDAVIALSNHFDSVFSTHSFGIPKEDPQFWPLFQRLHPFDPARTLLIDDSEPVLQSARDFGIGWLCAIRQPDTRRPPRDYAGFPGVNRVAELL